MSMCVVALVLALQLVDRSRCHFLEVLISRHGLVLICLLTFSPGSLNDIDTEVDEGLGISCCALSRPSRRSSLAELGHLSLAVAVGVHEPHARHLVLLRLRAHLSSSR